MHQILKVVVCHWEFGPADQIHWRIQSAGPDSPTLYYGNYGPATGKLVRAATRLRTSTMLATFASLGSTRVDLSDSPRAHGMISKVTFYIVHNDNHRSAATTSGLVRAD